MTDSELDSISIPNGVIPFDWLEAATNSFCDEQNIGHGGYGDVYKGVIQTGKEIGGLRAGQYIAVKIFRIRIDEPDSRQFKDELENLRKLQHQNIVGLIGYSYEEKQVVVDYNGRSVLAYNIKRAICLEYLHNGSLDKHISDESCGLDWNTRYEIIKGICEGVKYLHVGSAYHIYHLDLKPSNILLDKSMLPKVADFGLSRLFKLGVTQTHTTQNIIGTHGYMPPEYIDHGRISKKFDVFSLGVIIIEIMTGQKDRYPQLVDHVCENWRSKLMRDSSLDVEVCCRQIKRCIQIALQCVATNRHERPSIEDVTLMLREIDKLCALPVDERGNSEGFWQVLSLDLHPSDPWIMTSHHGGQVRIWNYETQVTAKSFNVTEKPVCTAKFIARKDWFVAGDHAGFMYVYNYNTMQKVVSYRAGGTHITSVAIHPTQPYVLSSSNDHLVKLWDWEKGWQCTQTFEGHTDIVWQVAFNPTDSNSFASVSDDRHVKIWSICSADIKSYKHLVDLLSVDYFTCGDQQYLITGSFNGDAYVWDLQTDECVQTLEGHTRRVSVVCSHEDSPILFTGSYDGTVRQWNSTRTNTFRLKDVLFNPDIGKVRALLCLKGSTRVVIGGEEGLSLIEIHHE